MSSVKKSKWWIFFVTTSGTSLVFLESSVMPVALPTIQKEFLFTNVGLVWVINSYLLSLTALLLIGGRLTDIFGKRSLFVWGLSFFGLGSLVSGFSFSQVTLLLGRVIQGVGGALMLPATGALLISAFPEGERAKAIGINTGISSIFLILGPALGGFFTEYLSWRGIFFINIPIIIFGIVMSYLILRPESRKEESFHFSGAAMLMIAISCLVVGLMQGSEWGWKSPFVIAFILVSPLFFYLFVRLSRKTEHPMVDFSFFKKRSFTLAVISILLVQTIVMATVLWAIYFQKQLHYSPAQTGMIIFGAVLPVFFMAPLGGYVADRFGPRLPILIGFGMLTFALFWLLFTAHATTFLKLLPGLLSFGASIALIMSPTVAMALSNVSSEKLGSAAGITTEARQIASTTGMALMTAVYTATLAATHSHVKAFMAISFFAACLSAIGFFIDLRGIKD